MLQRQSFAHIPLGPMVGTAKSAPRPYVPPMWLMLDARLGPALPSIIASLPPRSGIIVRPYAVGDMLNAKLLRSIRTAARARRHMLLLAGRGDVRGYDGQHLGGGAHVHHRRAGRMLTMPVHNGQQARQARRLKAHAVLISPVWPTRSHPGAHGIGLSRFAQLARQSGAAAIALGGLDATRFKLARHFGAVGWAGIDAFAR